jgi:glycosyltransferase involved in cell wall biosynthesis
MKIHLIVGCYNEERFLPYFLRHYSFCDKITFLDDHSTDRTHEIIKSYPNTEIILRDQPHGRPETDELIGLELANNLYKKDRSYDWVIITCMDEFLYHPNLLQKLEEYKRDGVTVPLTTGYNMWSDKFPTEDKPLEELVTLGEYSKNHSKSIIFNPKVDMNFGLGMHTC